MTTNYLVTQQSEPNLHKSAVEGHCDISDGNDNPNTEALSHLELIEIALYTIQKINNYPSSFGKTVDNYFHLLFPDEIKAYVARRQINSRSFKGAGFEGGSGRSSPNKVCQSQAMSPQAKQVRDIRSLCKLFVEQQENVLLLISDMLDGLEADLSGSDAGEGGAPDGK